jgi:tetratricopeptide (TPR) repeat protein
MKKPRTSRAERAPAPRPPSRRWLLAGSVALVAVVGVALWRGYRAQGTTFPAPRPAGPPPNVSYADFMGSEACAECHAAQYAAWKGSTHGHAGGAPSPERIIAPFDGRAMRFKDGAVTPSRSGRDYLFTVAQPLRPVRQFRVVAVVGGGFMAGGGTQAFFSQFPDGTVRFLPFDFSRAYNGWVCNTNGRANRGLVPITPAIAIADCGDWPPTRVLGSHERFEGCQQCHGSQILLEFDSTAKQYLTRYTTLAVNCESCHGAGRRHVELARSGHIGATADIGMRPLRTLAKARSLDVCFQCHTVKATLQAGYLPGAGLERHFALKFPGLLDTLFFADGRTRAFAYQEGHLSSDCYVNGSMTCVDCHDPHSQRYRDISDAPLPGRFDDGQCLDCHPSKAEQPERHTHHTAQSPGSRCTSCHMPYLQEPSVGPRVRYARSDHTISIPRPSDDRRLGIEDGCVQCHRDRTAERLEAEVTAWYGELKPRPAPLAQARAADSTSDRLAAARLALAGDDHDPMARFSAMGGFLERYITPDMAGLEPEIVTLLKALSGNGDRDVQALALATLHLARGSDAGVRRFLATRLRGLDSLDAPVRDRWEWTLRARGTSYLDTGDYQSALASYRKALEIKPDNPTVFRSLGIAYTRLRDYAGAKEALKRSLELEPAQPQVLVDLAFVQAQQGDVDAAVASYQQALAINPWEPAAYANLGLTYLRAGAVPSAIAALDRAVSINPALASANFALANAYQRAGRLADARAALERGLEFDPGNTPARQMLEALRANR